MSAFVFIYRFKKIKIGDNLKSSKLKSKTPDMKGILIMLPYTKRLASTQNQLEDSALIWAFSQSRHPKSSND